MLAGHALAHLLKAEGIPWVTGVSGESFLPFLDGMRAVELPFLWTVHESGATFLASAYARASGRPAVVAVTRGPGAANALIGVHEAWQAGAPMVVIVGQVETGLRGRSVLQEMEFTDVFRSVTKAVHEVTRPDRVAPAVAAALRQACLGRPGPVMVSVAGDHFFGQVPENPPGAAPRFSAPERGVLSQAQASRLIEAIRNARRCLLIAGADFANGRHAERLLAFARATGAAVMGGHAFPDVLASHEPQYLGVSTIRSSGVLRKALEEADLLIALCHRFGDRVTQGFVPLRGRLIAIAPAAEAAWDAYPGIEFLLADPVEALAQLASGPFEQTAAAVARAQWVAGLRRALDAESAALLEEERRNAQGIPFASLLEALDRMLPAASSIVSDAGTFNDWIVRYLPFRDGRTYHGPLSGSMGFGVPAALGVQMARRDPRTVVMTGDGGFLMTGMELATAVRLSLPVTVIVFNNRIWGSIAYHQDRHFPGARFAVDLPDVSFVEIARGLGAEGYRASNVAELAEHLPRALAAKGPALIEVMTDPARPSPVYYEKAHG